MPHWNNWSDDSFKTYAAVGAGPKGDPSLFKSAQLMRALGPLRRSAQAAALVLGLLVAVEHTARVRGWPEQQRPSAQLDRAYQRCRLAWMWLGARFSALSSYLEHLRLGELWLSLRAVGKPLLQTAASPRHFLDAYWEHIRTYAHPWLVAGGSSLLLGGALAAYARASPRLWPAQC